MNPYSRALIGLVVMVLIAVQQQQTVEAVAGFAGSEQSFSFGAKLDAAVICFERQLLKGTALPTTVSFRGAANVVFITTYADKYSRIGYQASMRNAALPQAAVNLQLTGPLVLPYNVLIQMWC